VPTVGDRVAQTVVTLAVTRKRCWERAWVLEYDIRGLFDNIDHGCFSKHCVIIAMSGGYSTGRPALSPVLANLFLHYALDHWLATHYPSVPFCRYADDGTLHCRTETEALQMREQVAARLRDCGLEMHPGKTRVVYCKDSNRIGSYENVQFDFIGYTFRPRFAQSRVGKRSTAFSPAMSRSSAKAIRQTVRSWRLSLRSDASLDDLEELIGMAGAVGEVADFVDDEDVGTRVMGEFYFFAGRASS